MQNYEVLIIKEEACILLKEIKIKEIRKIEIKNNILIIYIQRNKKIKINLKEYIKSFKKIYIVEKKELQEKKEEAEALIIEDF